MLHCDTRRQKVVGGCYYGCGGVSKPLLNKVVALDPGHGGVYSGGVHYGFRESDINLSVALKLRKKLERLGATVVMTRTRDVNLVLPDATLDADLKARVDFAKTFGADIFVSLHVDDVPNINLVGFASYFPEGGSASLACAIQKSLINETRKAGNGVSPANFYVLVHNDIPSTLVEMGYLSNPQEALCLMDNAYQNLLAEGILKGIIRYFWSQ